MYSIYRHDCLTDEAFDFSKILQTQGKYQVKPPLPFILGTEFAGRVSKDSPIPKGCPYKPGDRVFGAGQGTYADRVAIKWSQMLPLPDNISFDEGAGRLFPRLRYVLFRIDHETHDRSVHHMAHKL